MDEEELMVFAFTYQTFHLPNIRGGVLEMSDTRLMATGLVGLLIVGLIVAGTVLSFKRGQSVAEQRYLQLQIQELRSEAVGLRERNAELEREFMRELGKRDLAIFALKSQLDLLKADAQEIKAALMQLGVGQPEWRGAPPSRPPYSFPPGSLSGGTSNGSGCHRMMSGFGFEIVVCVNY